MKPSKTRPGAAAEPNPQHPEQRGARPHRSAAAGPPATRRQKTAGANAAAGTPAAPGLALPHERDEVSTDTAAAVDPVMAQARRDIDAGQVDTDMRATPGLDAAQRRRLVPGPGGRPPGTGG